ncbi:MAG: glycosyltransferase family 4 protein [bacterium]
MLKVCHIITRMILGGAQENTLLTVRGLHEDPGYEVDLVTGPALGPEGELLEEARSLGIEPIIISSLRREINPLNELRAFWAIYRLLKKGNYDIVHTHSSKAGVLGRWAAWLAGVELIVHTIHGLPFHEYQSKPEYLLYSGLERISARISDQIQTVCDRMAEKAAAAGVKPKQGFRTVYSGMELEEFLNVPPTGSEEALAVKKKWGYEAREFVFVKIARLFHLKGHKYCLEAFSQVLKKNPRARLLLVGDGVLRSELENMCAELSIEDMVKFAGLVPYQKIPEMLAASDCLVHASLREGLARVIPQAQASGRPVISFDIDGAPEAIDDRQSGILVKPKDTAGLAAAMTRVCEDNKFREKIIKQARSWVKPKFDWRHMVEEIKKCYEELPMPDNF